MGCREGWTLREILNHIRNLCDWNTGHFYAGTSRSRACGCGDGDCAVHAPYLAIWVVSSLDAGVWFHSVLGLDTEPICQFSPSVGSENGGRYASSICMLPSRVLRRGLSSRQLSYCSMKLTPHHELSCEESQTCLNYNLLVGPWGVLNAGPKFPLTTNMFAQTDFSSEHLVKLLSLNDTVSLDQSVLPAGCSVGRSRQGGGRGRDPSFLFACSPRRATVPILGGEVSHTHSRPVLCSLPTPPEPASGALRETSIVWV